jgi:hypothetical protein
MVNGEQCVMVIMVIITGIRMMGAVLTMDGEALTLAATVTQDVGMVT